MIQLEGLRDETGVSRREGLRKASEGVDESRRTLKTTIRDILNIRRTPVGAPVKWAGRPRSPGEAERVSETSDSRKQARNGRYPGSVVLVSSI